MGTIAPREDAVVRFANAIMAWAVASTVVLAVLTLGLDTALVAASRAPWRSAWLTGVAGLGIAPFIAIAFAPFAAALETACRAIAHRRPRFLWPLPIAIAAWLFGALVSGVLQASKAIDLLAVTAFAAAIVVAALAASARRAPLLGSAMTAFALYAGARLPVARGDWQDLLAVVTACALMAALTPMRRRLGSVRRERLLVVFAVILAAGAGAMTLVGRAPPTWRTASMHHARFESRLAHLCRAAVDLDGDGFSSIAWGGDCDDSDPHRNPRAHELPNGIDSNCNGTVRPPNPTDAERGLAPPAGDPNAPDDAVDFVVLVTIDAWRADSLRPDVMPNVVGLASRGVTMTRMYTAGTATRVTLRVSLRAAADEASAASRLALAGVAPSTVFAFRRDELSDALLDGFTDVRVPALQGARFNAHETTNLALEAVNAPHRGPRFLWIHYYDAHQPLVEITPGDKPDYLAELGYIDREIGRLLSAIPASRTMMILTADHGEAFDPYGIAYHSVTANDALMHVPAIVIAPGLAAGRYDGLATSRDLAPTILGAFGRCDASTERFGRSWWRLRDAPTAPLHEFVVTYSAEAVHGATHVMPMAALIEPRLKLVETFERTLVEVYDPARDPEEDDDLASDEPFETARLRRKLAIYRDIDGYF